MTDGLESDTHDLPYACGNCDARYYGSAAALVCCDGIGGVRAA